MSKQHFVWVEEYRPKTIEECILPNRLRTIFNKVIEDNNLPNFLFYSSEGKGKTTVARALANQLGSDLLVINGSDQRNIDTLRTTIRDFVSTVSLSDAPKIVLLDEADYLNPNSTQPALRNFIEEFSKSSRFILTCNYPEKILSALKSRLVSVDFNLTKAEQKEVINSWNKRLHYILEDQKIEYSQKILNQVILNNFPDYRKTINELQKHSVDGKLNVSAIESSNNSDIQSLVEIIKERSFTKAREWIANNPSVDIEYLISELYKKVDKFVVKEFIPKYVLTANTYAYQSSFVLDKQINILAFIAELMLELEFI